MTKLLFSFIALALTLAVEARGATYTRTSNLFGKSFFDAFEWEDIPDPTHGNVCVHPDVLPKDSEMRA